jgi:SAM-dependent methyltransferase
VIYDDPDLYDAQYRSYRDDLPFYRRLADDQGGPVLELGAGTGRVTRALAASGHRVVAIERSAAMLDRARERLQAEGLADRVELIEGDMRTLALPERFPLVIAPFNTLMHATTPADQDATLTGVHRQLAPGGAFGFDLFVPRHLGPLGVLRQEPSWQGVGGEGAELFLMQHHDEAAQLIESRYLLDRVIDGRLTRTARVLRQRYYTRFELLRALQQAGFTSIRIFGSFDRAPFDSDTPLMAGIAR